jgi:hypothetical protein
VVVAGDAAKPMQASDAPLLAPIDATGAARPLETLADQDFRWTPERAPTGPLTIVVSKRDQAIVVLRNGVEIGRSRAQIADDDPGTHVINLTTGPDGAQRWIYVGVPGHDADAGQALDEAILNRVKLPRGFYEAVKARTEARRDDPGHPVQRRRGRAGPPADHPGQRDARAVSGQARAVRRQPVVIPEASQRLSGRRQETGLMLERFVWVHRKRRAFGGMTTGAIGSEPPTSRNSAAITASPRSAASGSARLKFRRIVELARPRPGSGCPG